MKRAEERIKDFQKANDTFNMDVDLETAAARAHLAYFTRPRTVDIFAEFKGTDLGKIMSGMTAGATGVRGWQCRRFSGDDEQGGSGRSGRTVGCDRCFRRWIFRREELRGLYRRVHYEVGRLAEETVGFVLDGSQAAGHRHDGRFGRQRVR